TQYLLDPAAPYLLQSVPWPEKFDMPINVSLDVARVTLRLKLNPPGDLPASAAPWRKGEKGDLLLRPAFDTRERIPGADAVYGFRYEFGRVDEIVFPALQAARWSFEVRPPDEAPWESTVTLKSGETTIDVAFKRAADVVFESIRVTPFLGTHEVELFRDGEPFKSQLVVISTLGRKSCIRNLPAGSYQLRLRAKAHAIEELRARGEDVSNPFALKPVETSFEITGTSPRFIDLGVLR
ncbi:MAG: hypothetical protein M3463_20970, partial [Verrucomicrobiota bacterium]|nr:hypothetical protein [Verrucomicrobiota bacterium]